MLDFALITICRWKRHIVYKIALLKRSWEITSFCNICNKNDGSFNVKIEILTSLLYLEQKGQIAKIVISTYVIPGNETIGDYLMK